MLRRYCIRCETGQLPHDTRLATEVSTWENLVAAGRLRRKAEHLVEISTFGKPLLTTFKSQLSAYMLPVRLFLIGSNIRIAAGFPCSPEANIYVIGLRTDGSLLCGADGVLLLELCGFFSEGALAAPVGAAAGIQWRTVDPIARRWRDLSRNTPRYRGAAFSGSARDRYQACRVSEL